MEAEDTVTPKRDPQMVLNDVLNEYITLEKAKEDYGVIIEEVNGSLEINEKETEKLRKV